MPKTRQQKADILKGLAEKVKAAKSLVVSTYSGLKVSDFEQFRNKCREANTEVIAAKKTLIGKVLKEQGIEGLDTKAVEGSVAVVLGQDEVSPAKITVEFAKGHEQLKYWQGVLESKLISREMVKSLASLPSKHELLGKVVGTIKAPISGFVNVLAGNLRGLVNVLNSIKNNKQ
jgi:large subunit ribosomal protein L10